MQDLIFSYPCFASSQELMELIIERYNGTAIASESITISPGSSIKKLQVIQIR